MANNNAVFPSNLSVHLDRSDTEWTSKEQEEEDHREQTDQPVLP